MHEETKKVLEEVRFVPSLKHNLISHGKRIEWIYDNNKRGEQ